VTAVLSCAEARSPRSAAASERTSAILGLERRHLISAARILALRTFIPAAQRPDRSIERTFYRTALGVSTAFECSSYSVERDSPMSPKARTSPPHGRSRRRGVLGHWLGNSRIFRINQHCEASRLQKKLVQKTEPLRRNLYHEGEHQYCCRPVDSGWSRGQLGSDHCQCQKLSEACRSPRVLQACSTV